MYKAVRDLEARGVRPPYIDIRTFMKVKPEREKWKGMYKKILRDPRSSSDEGTRQRAT